MVLTKGLRFKEIVMLKMVRPLQLYTVVSKINGKYQEIFSYFPKSETEDPSKSDVFFDCQSKFSMPKLR